LATLCPAAAAAAGAAAGWTSPLLNQAHYPSHSAPCKAAYAAYSLHQDP
jgi:hypothetical protein